MRAPRLSVLAVVAVAGAALVGSTASAPAGASAAVGASATSPTRPTHRTVTLVTGDRVEVSTTADGRTTAAVAAPRPGSAPFRTFRAGPHLYVIPRSAVPQVGRSLALSRFDVTAPGRVGVTPRFPMHTLTVNGIDPTGRPDTGDGVGVFNTDDVRRFFGFQGFFHGQLKFSVPDGHYAASAQFFPRTLGGRVRIAALPQFTVAGDTTITIDARTATSRVSVTTPRPADVGGVEIGVLQTDAHGGLFGGVFGFGPGFDIAVSPTRPVTVGQLHYYTYWRLVAPDGSYTYDLEFPADGAIPADQHNVVATSQLATVAARYFSAEPGTGLETRFSFLPWQNFAFRSLFPVAQPGHRTEYVSVHPDIVWVQNVVADVDLRSFLLAGLQFDSAQTYATRRRVTSQWNKQPIHPGVPADLGTSFGLVCPACRIGDKLGLAVWPFADNQLGHYGFPDVSGPGLTERLSSAIYQNGVRVAHAPALLGLFRVAAHPSTFRLVQDTLRRSAFFTLSTQSHSEWTFRSSHRDGHGTLPSGWQCPDGTADCSVLPLMMARYDLPLSLSDRMPAGASRFTLDVTHVQGAPALPVTAVSVSVSYDDGATWHPAGVTGRGGGRFAVAYRTPARSATNGYVALRVSATDATGGRLRQQVLRAYPIG